MERDPDYIDPQVLRKRAKVGGGAKATPGRPRVRRVRDAVVPSGVRMTRELSVVVESSTITKPGVRVDAGDRQVIIR